MNHLLSAATEACYELYKEEEESAYINQSDPVQNHVFIHISTTPVDTVKHLNAYWEVVVRHEETGRLFARTFCSHSEWGINDDASEKEATEVEAVEVKVIKYFPKKLERKRLHVILS